MFEICSDLFKTVLKTYYFCWHLIKAKKWPNHYISGKQFQIRPKLADLAFQKAKWQPCLAQHTHTQALAEKCFVPWQTYVPCHNAISINLVVNLRGKIDWIWQPLPTLFHSILTNTNTHTHTHTHVLRLILKISSCSRVA